MLACLCQALVSRKWNSAKWNGSECDRNGETERMLKTNQITKTFEWVRCTVCLSSLFILFGFSEPINSTKFKMRISIWPVGEIIKNDEQTLQKAYQRNEQHRVRDSVGEKKRKNSGTYTLELISKKYFNKLNVGKAYRRRTLFEHFPKFYFVSFLHLKGIPERWDAVMRTPYAYIRSPLNNVNITHIILETQSSTLQITSIVTLCVDNAVKIKGKSSRGERGEKETKQKWRRRRTLHAKKSVIHEQYVLSRQCESVKRRKICILLNRHFLQMEMSTSTTNIWTHH